MGKYLELFRSAFDSSIDEKTKLENRPYVAYSTVTGDVVYTVVPKKEEEDTDTTFRFISREDDNVVDFSNKAWLGHIADSKKQNVYLKVNDGEWVSIANQTSFTLNTGDKLYFKNEGEDLKAFNDSSASIGTTTKTFDVAGNVDEFMIPSGNMTDRQYSDLFKNTKVVDASKLLLRATTLAERCYQSMFYECTSLTTAPELPTTTLAPYCYQSMFYNCTSLTTAPALPATTLAGNCYQSMFRDCSSLTSAPELPATTLVEGCYYWMFRGCASLNHIKCLATDISANSCTGYWVDMVSNSGTFVKHPATTWETGLSGIPSGWTVVDAEI